MAALGLPYSFIIAYLDGDLVYEYGSYQSCKELLDDDIPVIGFFINGNKTGHLMLCAVNVVSSVIHLDTFNVSDVFELNPDGTITDNG